MLAGIDWRIIFAGGYEVDFGTMRRSSARSLQQQYFTLRQTEIITLTRIAEKY